MLLEFLRWWYGPGWMDAWKNAAGFVASTERAFSVAVLLKTLFAPWKQIVALPGRSLDEKFRAAVDNLVSRTVGFFARLTALIAALVLGLLSAILGFTSAVLWPLLPPAFLYLIFRSIVG